MMNPFSRRTRARTKWTIIRIFVSGNTLWTPIDTYSMEPLNNLRILPTFSSTWPMFWHRMHQKNLVMYPSTIHYRYEGIYKYSPQQSDVGTRNNPKISSMIRYKHEEFQIYIFSMFQYRNKNSSIQRAISRLMTLKLRNILIKYSKSLKAIVSSILAESFNETKSARTPQSQNVSNCEDFCIYEFNNEKTIWRI